MFQTKFVEKNKTQRMRFACWIIKAIETWAHARTCTRTQNVTLHYTHNLTSYILTRPWIMQISFPYQLYSWTHLVGSVLQTNNLENPHFVWDPYT